MVWLVYGLALVKLVLPFLLQHPIYEPHRDEFLYLAESRHPAWGYLGSPPMLSLLGWCSNLPGAGFFWIKFWPALFGAMTYILVGRWILLLGGGRFAIFLAFLPFIFGSFLQLHFLLAPGFLGVYFQTMMVYGLVLYLRRGGRRGLYLAGIGFGLGMLSDYTTLPFAAWLVIGLLLTPARKVLRNPHFYIAFCFGLLLFVPNLIWQAVHDWPVLSEWAGRDAVSAKVFLRDLVCFNLPGIFVWVAGLVGLAGTREGTEYRWAAVAVLGTGIMLGCLRVSANHLNGVYPTLFCFGAIALERMTGFRRRVWRYGLVGFCVVTGVVMDTAFLPMMPPRELAAFYSAHPVFRRLGFLGWTDGKDHALPQKFAGMLGWEEMAIKAARAYESLDSLDQAGVLLDGGGNCGEAGALDYYAPKYSLPPVMGCRANYVLWTPATYYDREVFIVTTKDRGEMKKFASAVVIDSVTHPYSTEYGSYIILVRGPNAEVRAEWKRSYRAMHREQLAAR